MSTITISANTSWYLFNFRSSTIRQLLARGYRVVCLSPPDKYSDRLVSELGCEWFPLEMNNSGNNPIQDMGLILQFWRYYRRFRPVAALHFTIKNNVYGTWAARALGVPVINNVSGLGTAFIHKGLVSAIVRMLYKTSQPFAHRIFCQNEEDLQQLVDARLVPPDRLELLPGSGVDLVRFNSSLKVSPGGPFRFLYAGRMLADKGLYELIAAVRSLNATGVECELWLVGFAGVGNVSAIGEAQLKEWAGIPGIQWLGPNDAMESIYAQVDCVVLPSYREGMPRSLLEAGAMGLPVIATDVPGCRNIVTDGYNGLLCEVKSSESLMQSLQAMLAMTDGERTLMGKNGRALVAAKFDERLVLEATLRAVESAVQQQ
ncbi:N,N'-diacetylbacillosaminyl-diphospho-undecaprenol alpha-1,3-N-acetylgalactosaminyltransferase [Halioglobus japonicus]|nr:N,N'-diacetylbacillosaminyl-diphospho-undecaprenol alpha-1,3-N-acetylgalactosaminyltransferase [Halioglobus japonicus]